MNLLTRSLQAVLAGAIIWGGIFLLNAIHNRLTKRERKLRSAQFLKAMDAKNYGSANRILDQKTKMKTSVKIYWILVTSLVVGILVIDAWLEGGWIEIFSLTIGSSFIISCMFCEFSERRTERKQQEKYQKQLKRAGDSSNSPESS